MSQEFWVVLYAVVYALQLFIGKGINWKNIVKSGATLRSELTTEFNTQIKEPLLQIVELQTENIKLKAVNTVILTDILANYQKRLELTNDEAEQAELLALINKYSELLK